MRAARDPQAKRMADDCMSENLVTSSTSKRILFTVPIHGGADSSNLRRARGQQVRPQQEVSGRTRTYRLIASSISTSIKPGANACGTLGVAALASSPSVGLAAHSGEFGVSISASRQTDRII